MAWEKVEIKNDEGFPISAQAPEIISASRSTDIPAFYADWFFNRLEKGYSAWINPFNGVKSYVSYQNTHFIVFWSKNPRPLLDYFHILEKRNIKCYIQYSLNDYENETLEKVPPLEKRIETFKLLVDRLGKGCVIWRFDPMILSDNITIDVLLERVTNIGDQLKDYTEKLVFSYADIVSYNKVKRNLEQDGFPYHEWTEFEMDEFACKLSELNKIRGWNFDIATCGEKINLEKYGIKHNRCIDGDLITRIAWKDKELMDFMKVKIHNLPAPSLFGGYEIPADAIILPDNHYFVSSHKKDPGQRLLCGCMIAKDIGEYNTCPHLCEYCYANSSKKRALENWKQHLKNPFAETITGR